MSFYLILAFQLFISNCLKCGTDLLNIVPGKIKINNIKRKTQLTVSEYAQIKIKVDMTQIEQQNQKNIMSNEKLQNLKNIFNEVVESFQKIISVQHFAYLANDYSYLIKENCGIDYFDETLKSGVLSDDLLIFPSLDLDNILSENVLAAATPCIQAENSNRPLAGIVLINKDLMTNKYDYNYYMKNLLFHELTHVLGFHPSYFKILGLTHSETIDGEKYTYINSKKVLERAKIHFGCDSIKGVQLENQGGDGSMGSHWESRYMLGDYMISSDYTEVVMSDITLALLEDTGYYKINYYTGGLFRFGKNQGCAFLEKKCLYDKGQKTLFSNEFCVNGGEAFCSGSNIAKGDCYITNYQNQLSDKYRYFEDNTKGGLPIADYCPVSNLYKSDLDNNYFYPKNCIYGKKEFILDNIGSNSICFESSISSSNKESICYEIECKKSEKKFNVKIGNSVVTCPGEDANLNNPNNLEGVLHCPDYNMVCTSDTWCNEMFDCIDKESVTDDTTYDYISNKQALIVRDRENLLVKESHFEDKDSFLNIKLKNIFYFLCLLFL